MMRRSPSSGMSLVEVMVSGLILTGMALGVAQLFSGMSTTSKYTRAYNVRTALETTLRAAVLSPRLLCKSLHGKVPDAITGVSYNPTVDENESFSNCVSGTKFTAKGITECRPVKGQFLSIWDDSGKKENRIAGGNGLDKAVGGGVVDEAVYFDISGKQCSSSPSGNRPDAACPFKASATFWPACRDGTATSCPSAETVRVYYRLEIFPNIPGGAPLADSDNALTAAPIETWRILSACRVAGEKDPICPTGMYMTGTYPDGRPKCGILPNLGNIIVAGKQCPNPGEVVVGFRVNVVDPIPPQTDPQHKLEPVCMCPPGTYLGQIKGTCRCVPTEAPRNELGPPDYFYAATGFAFTGNTRFDDTLGKLDFKRSKVEAAGTISQGPPPVLAPKCNECPITQADCPAGWTLKDSGEPSCKCEAPPPPPPSAVPGPPKSGPQPVQPTPPPDPEPDTGGSYGCSGWGINCGPGESWQTSSCSCQGPGSGGCCLPCNQQTGMPEGCRDPNDEDKMTDCVCAICQNNNVPADCCGGNNSATGECSAGSY